MAIQGFGLAVAEPTPSQSLEMIVRADQAGIPVAWVPTGFAGPDALTLLAAAALRTKTIKLGTSIVPTFPRHPLVTAQQAEVIEDLAPGRLLLGVGPSHAPIIVDSFGIPFDRPLEHLREYVTILKTALQEGKVDFEGARFKVHAQLPARYDVPVLISALRPASFRLAGALTDGAIANFCPPAYIRDVALPALREGAAKANRPAPPMLNRAFIAFSNDVEAVARVARQRMSIYRNLPFYTQMLVTAGFPEAESGEWSQRMIDAAVFYGDEAAIADRMRANLAESGAQQLTVSVLPIGDPQAEAERGLRLIGSLSR